jgi:menaquinone-dependent protoporphyrinogen oxidase
MTVMKEVRTMRRALVVFGSKNGGTAGLARMIGGELSRNGWTVIVQDAEQAADLRDLDLVIIGGALHANRWHRAARSFVRKNEQALRNLPVWLFSSGPLDDSARSGDIAPVPHAQELARRIEAYGHMTFGGVLARDAHGFFAHAMAKKFAGDYRDRSQVADWVRQIEHDLAPVEVTVPSPRAAGHDDVTVRTRNRAAS